MKLLVTAVAIIVIATFAFLAIRSVLSGHGAGVLGEVPGRFPFLLLPPVGRCCLRVFRPDRRIAPEIRMQYRAFMTRVVVRLGPHDARGLASRLREAARRARAPQSGNSRGGEPGGGGR